MYLKNKHKYKYSFTTIGSVSNQFSILAKQRSAANGDAPMMKMLDQTNNLEWYLYHILLIYIEFSMMP